MRSFWPNMRKILAVSGIGGVSVCIGDLRGLLRPKIRVSARATIKKC